jgi:hypothetical protein
VPSKINAPKSFGAEWTIPLFTVAVHRADRKFRFKSARFGGIMDRWRLPPVQISLSPFAFAS